MHAASTATPRSPLLSPLSVVCDDPRIGRRLVEVLGCPDAPVFLLDTVEDADLDGTRRLILWVSNPPLDLLRDRIRRSRPMRRVVMVAPPSRTALFKLGAAEGVPVVGCPSSLDALAKRLSDHLGLRRETPLPGPSPLRAVTPLPPPPPRVSSEQLIDELERSLRRRLGPSAALQMERPDTLSFLVEKAAEAVIGELRQAPGSALVSLDEAEDESRARATSSSGWYRRPTEDAPDAPTKPWPALPAAEPPPPVSVFREPAEAVPTESARPAENRPGADRAAASPEATSRRKRRTWPRVLAVVLSAALGVGLALAVHHFFQAEIESFLLSASPASAATRAEVQAAPAGSSPEAARPTPRVVERAAELDVEPSLESVDSEQSADLETEAEAVAQPASSDSRQDEARERRHRRRARARARARAAAANTATESSDSSDSSDAGDASSAASPEADAPTPEAVSTPSDEAAPAAEAAGVSTSADPGAVVLDPWAG